MNYYEVLGIDKYASIKDIDKSYKLLVKKLTSGVLESEIPISRSMLQKVEQAHATLSNDLLRKRYDDNLHSQPPAEEDDPIEIMCFKNIQGYKYDVETTKNGCGEGKFLIPQYCVCCMSKDINKASKAVGANFEMIDSWRTKETTLSLDFPICEECEAHMKKPGPDTTLMLVPAVMAGVVSGLIRGFYSGQIILSLFLPVLVAACLFIVLSALIKMKKLSIMHSSRIKAGNIRAFTEATITFEFYNWMFAKMFAANNHGVITEKRTRQYQNYNSYLLARNGIGVIALGTLIFTIFAIGLSFIFA